MGRRLPSLNALKAFEAAGRLESFTDAAAELFVTHAAISRHVRDLEEWLGTELFIRTGRGVQLTDAGAALLVEARYLPGCGMVAWSSGTRPSRMSRGISRYEGPSAPL